MKTFWNTQGGLSQLTEWQPNCWIQVTCPTEDDQRELEEKFNIPDYFMSDISDTDERARYEYDDGWMLIILRIPYVKEIRSRTPYTTVPLGIIHKRDVTITVCFYETIRQFPAETRRGIHRSRRYDLPSVPLQRCLVPETFEANINAR